MMQLEYTLQDQVDQIEVTLLVMKHSNWHN
jgi:hypothetical protein